MRATIWALLVVSRRVGHALQPGRGPVFCRTGDNGGTHGRLSASQTRHFVPKQSSHQHLTFWTTLLLLPKSRRRPPQQPEATTGVSPFQLWAAGSEDVEPFPGLSSFNLEEEEGDEDGYYVLDDEGDYGGGGNDGEGEEGLEHEDRFGLLSADPNPPPLEEAWALAAAELSAEVPGPNGESAGAVDLDLLEVPPWSNPLLNDDDDGEKLDLDSLDVADFLAPEVEVGAVDPGVPGYGNVGAGGGPPGLRSASVVAKKRPRQGGMGGYVGEDGGDSGSGADDASNGGGSGKDWGGVGKPTKAPAEKPKSKGVSGQGVKARRGGGGGEGAGVGAGGLDGLTADEVERKLISAGILRADGAEIDLEEEREGGEGEGWGGVYNEIEVSDGEEACRILEERLGFDQEGIAYLRAKYPPLRGELWYRREPAPAGAKTGKKFLDVYFLEETLPELLDLLLGDEEEEAAHEEGGGIGLTVEQVREMFTMTPSLLGMEASDANDVATYLRLELGLRGQGRLAGALAGCPPMLMYHTWDNLRKKVSYYREALAWTNYDVAAMLAVYPNFLSIKMENDVIEVIDYLRTEIGLQPFMVSTMVRDFPEVLEVRPKRLKAVVKYLWKVLEIPRSGIAVLLSQHPRACSLEAEANLAPLRQFFERELFVEDTARIGHLVYKFPRLLFQDVETQLVPRAEEFRKAMGLEGLEPLPPRIRDRPKRNKRKEEYAAWGRGGRGQSGVGRGAGGGSGRPRSSNGSGGVGGARGRGARSGAGRPRAANSGFGGRGREAPGGRGGRAGRMSSGGRGRGEYRGRGSGGYVE